MSDRGNLEYESIESILSRAFAPVEPPERMYAEVESLLADISLSAAEELADWELAAMRDPRNWVRPAVALAAGSAAAGALLVLGMRGRRRDDTGAQAVRAMADALGGAAENARDEIVRTAREEIRRAARDLSS
jgi:hypothetical protein